MVKQFGRLLDYLERAGLRDNTLVAALRDDLGLTGTKVGCDAGDCGACTIVVARPRDGTMRYEAVNSCLMLLPQLDGAAHVDEVAVDDVPRLRHVAPCAGRSGDR